MDGKNTGQLYGLRHNNRSPNRTRGPYLPGGKGRGANLYKHGATGAVLVDTAAEERSQPQVALFSLVLTTVRVLVRFVTQPASSG